MFRPVNNLDLLAGVVDPWGNHWILPPADEDVQELEVGDLLRNIFQLAQPDEDQDDWDDADSGYGSCSDEEEEEEEVEEEVEEEEEEEDHGRRLSPEEVWARWYQQVFLQPVQNPSPAPSPVFEEEHVPSSPAAALPAPASPPVGLALDFLPLGGSKRHRDEEDEDVPVSKRQRSEDSDDDDAPSTSAGTSGGFRRYFHHQLQHSASAPHPPPVDPSLDFLHHSGSSSALSTSAGTFRHFHSPHLLQDSESDED
ncbi:hypothetical protein WMY93_022178 [Mugilogobius chulae]|uniref:Uncharacterized protein n=1 Tax=Mugilogobius chulae TaxID=88201 RepID=A0AAW0NPV4_9GOBI